MKTDSKHRLLLVNDDGWIMTQSQPPLRVSDLKERMVDTYRDTPVGALLWCIGNREVYHFESQVGEVFDAACSTPEDGESEGSSAAFDDPTQSQYAANIRSLRAERGGPLGAMVKLCHQAGLDLFPSVRMNSHYYQDPDAPGAGRFRKEHPEALIGEVGVTYPEHSLEWGVRTGVDYAHPEVRRYMAAVICELFERFDVAGVELDFMRHPTYFRLSEGYANRHLMTDLVRQVRRRMDEVAKERGRKIDLAVRVPPTLADSKRLGLDVAAWMAEGLVDIAIAGGGFIPFETPIEEFVRAAEGTGCLVYGPIERLRPAVDEELVRAIAARHWDAGVSGLYLFNYYADPVEWKRRVFAEIADPAVLRRLNKRYQLDNTRFHWDYRRDPTERDLHDYAFQNAVPIGQLPVALAETLTDRGPSIRFSLADDVEAAAAEGTLAKCTLKLGFTNCTGEDELEVRLNGEVLNAAASTVSYGDWSRFEWRGYPGGLGDVTYTGATMAFELASPPLRRGDNDLEVRLRRRVVQASEPVRLVEVEVSVNYTRASSL